MADKEKNIRIEYSQISEGKLIDADGQHRFWLIVVCSRYETQGNRTGLDKGVEV